MKKPEVRHHEAKGNEQHTDGRNCVPEELTGTLLYLISDLSKRFTGVVIPVDKASALIAECRRRAQGTGHRAQAQSTGLRAQGTGHRAQGKEHRRRRAKSKGRRAKDTGCRIRNYIVIKNLKITRMLYYQ
jgi:hypothetical protein